MNIRKFALGFLALIIITTAIFLYIKTDNKTSDKNSTTSVSPTPTPVDHLLAAADAKNLINENSSNPDFIIVDVRTPDEFKNGHLKGARVINFNSADFKENVKQLDSSKKYLIYCGSGKRSAQAYTVFKDAGIKNVYELKNGISGWEDQSMVVKG